MDLIRSSPTLPSLPGELISYCIGDMNFTPCFDLPALVTSKRASVSPATDWMKRFGTKYDRLSVSPKTTMVTLDGSSTTGAEWTGTQLPNDYVLITGASAGASGIFPPDLMAVRPREAKLK
ncbi:MAG: hypothetical protein ACOZIN_07875 [Myxococcota bacterium]